MIFFYYIPKSCLNLFVVIGMLSHVIGFSHLHNMSEGVSPPVDGSDGPHPGDDPEHSDLQERSREIEANDLQLDGNSRFRLV